MLSRRIMQGAPRRSAQQEMGGLFASLRLSAIRNGDWQVLQALDEAAYLPDKEFNVAITNILAMLKQTSGEVEPNLN